MSNLRELQTYPAGIYQIEDGEAFDGGPDGLANVQATALAHRTKWLKAEVESLSVLMSAAATRGPEMPMDAQLAPTVGTADNRLAIGTNSGTGGGKITVASGQSLAVGLSVTAGITCRNASWTTPAYDSGWLATNTTYYLRAQESAGALILYLAIGTDADAVPSSRKGTPGAASGGGFPSTVVDAKIAKIQTGAAGTAPTVTAIANSPAIAEAAAIASGIALAFSGQGAGYQIFPGGLMIQWGAATANASSYATIVFPVSFSNATPAVVVSRSDAFSILTADIAQVGDITKTGCTLWSATNADSTGAGTKMNWIAIGK